MRKTYRKAEKAALHYTHHIGDTVNVNEQASSSSTTQATTEAAGSGRRCPVFDPFDDGYLADPYPTLQAMRDAAPVAYDEGLDMWVVTGWAEVDAVFRDPDTFSAAIAQDPLVPLDDQATEILARGFRPIRTMSNLDGPEHTRIRIHNQVGFSPRRLRAMDGTIREVATAHLDAAAPEPGVPFDVVQALTFPLPAEIIFALLGFPPGDAEQIKAWCGTRMSFSWGRPDIDEQISIAGNMVNYWRYCEDHIDRRLAEPGDDFTSDLLAVHLADPQSLSLAEVTHVVYGLSFAGHETTTNLLSNALRRLLERRSRWEALCADPSLIPATVDEVLRHDSSVIAWRRITTEPTTLGGTDLPAGAKLLLMLAAANRDPAVFDDPDAFEIGRPNAARHLSFGFGKHYCLGATLAKAELRIVLEELVQRWPDLELCDQELSFHPNVSFRGPEQLLLRRGPTVPLA